jgi:prepilin-type processing-associated H-X9-DG protein/prepilin-type N-terminal cleavage/methylation domain-containing protein
MKRYGFTWLELLVVLAAVVILAAILFPIFARRSDPPHGRSCQSNIRQIALAMKQYIADSDDNFPGVTGVGYMHGWADSLVPYIRTTVLFQCPVEASDARANDGATSPYYCDYFYNSRLANRSVDSLQYIANTTMLGDAVTGDARQHSTGGNTDKPGIATLVNANGAFVGAATRHLDGANYAFGDGHVKWLKGSNANTCPSIRDAATPADAAHPTFAVD